MSELASKKCVPCEGGIPPLKGEQIESLQKHVKEWEVVDEHHLKKQFKFPNFKQALSFVNRVGDVAEAEGHHPNICFTWGKADVTIWTHTVGGLTENDFILAAKIDQL